MLASKGGPGNGGPGLLKEDLGPLREGSDGETSDYQRSTPSPRDADDMVMELNSEGGFLITIRYLPLSIFCHRGNLTHTPHFQLRTSPTVPLHLRRTGEQKRTSLTLDSSTVPTQHPPPPPPSPTPPLPPPPTPPNWTATSPPRWRASPPSPPPPPCWANS